MKALTHIDKVREDQVAFGKKLDLDLHGCNVTVAAARIEDAMDVGFRGVSDLGAPTQKQIELAARFDYDITGLSRREATAIIEDPFSAQQGNNRIPRWQWPDGQGQQ